MAAWLYPTQSSLQRLNLEVLLITKCCSEKKEFQLMQILGLLFSTYHAVVVFVINFSLLFRLAVTILVVSNPQIDYNFFNTFPLKIMKWHSGTVKIIGILRLLHFIILPNISVFISRSFKISTSCQRFFFLQHKIM